ncbi:hypothetical protein CPG37_04175 [Malaciobacter canalis]|uniref:Uncharacterized protein n=1 Tax=Malaciobacter canalis TaxID=1912871 RepID=A0ABX4LQM9_9BACT|nr:hypothetical protein CPG37_04175 [Malaciobacter canalis]
MQCVGGSNLFVQCVGSADLSVQKAPNEFGVPKVHRRLGFIRAKSPENASETGGSNLFVPNCPE